jgi:hypothetical protein
MKRNIEDRVEAYPKKKNPSMAVEIRELSKRAPVQTSRAAGRRHA